MAKFGKDTIESWRSRIQDWLLANSNLDTSKILTGRDAWTVAHMSGIVREAHEDRSVVDAHIQTVLEQIFPNAVFKSKKVY